eukprot:GCRY01001492.1.p1 GENE.GCRY01001492.1~~GCRY01001492.1.p1  ORF type:complete len:210 (+),score=33.58 GCRY01001492.1:118-747(+)
MSGIVNVEPLYCAEQITVPEELPLILKEFTKEVIRVQPKNLIAFSAEYFTKLARSASAGGGAVSVELLKQLVEQFSLLDSQKTGTLTQDEIEATCEAVGFPRSSLNEIFTLGNFGGSVPWEDLCVLGCSLVSESLRVTISNIIQAFADINGEIPLNQLLQYLSYLHTKDSSFSDELIDEFSNQLTVAADGRGGCITLEDFEQSDVHQHL